MSLEDWKEAMEGLRQHRNAAQSPAKARSKAPVDVQALKDSLKGLRKA